MIYIQTHSTDPTWNLALEEYCQTGLTQFPKIFMFWQNDNAIIVGRYQNAAREINIPAARELGVRVVRRSTGGGTVYHDLGNLNYSFIVPCESAESLDKTQLSIPIMRALGAMGIEAEVSGRNDILLNGKKISGTAQSLKKNRLLHHGTLLFDSNMSVLTKVLNVDKTKLQSKGIASVKSRVTNIRQELNFDINISEFWAGLLKGFEPYEEYVLTEEDLKKVREIQKEKYAAWDWTVGSEPAFTAGTEKRYPQGLLSLAFNVERNVLTRCRISGDFLGVCDISLLEEKLEGTKYEPGEIKKVLDETELVFFLGGITAEEFVDCMFSQIVV